MSTYEDEAPTENPVDENQNVDEYDEDDNDAGAPIGDDESVTMRDENENMNRPRPIPKPTIRGQKPITPMKVDPNESRIVSGAGR